MNANVRRGVREALEAVGYYGRELTIVCYDWALEKRHGHAGREVVQESGKPFHVSALGADVTHVEIPVGSLTRATSSAGPVGRAVLEGWTKGMRQGPGVFRPVLLHFKLIEPVVGGASGSVVMRYPHDEWYVQSGDDAILYDYMTSGLGVSEDRIIGDKYACWSARESVVYLDL